MYNNNQDRYQQNGNRNIQQPFHSNSSHQQHHHNKNSPYSHRNHPFNCYEDAFYCTSRINNLEINYMQNTGQNLDNRQDFYMNFQQRTSGKASGKRAHEYVSPTASVTSMKKGESSPAPKRQLYKQNSEEASRNLRMAKKNQAGTSNKQPMQLKNINRPESHTKFIQNLKEKEWKDLFKETLLLLENCKPGEEVNMLLNKLQPPRMTWSQLKSQIHNDMIRLMSPLGVDALLVFGSTLTGLDFVGSDLDYHIRLKVLPRKPEEVKDIITKASKLTRSYHNQDFRVIYVIASARVPIIRLIHQSSRTTCDVNFTSQFGYHNSRFIQNILLYDQRIKDLAVILKLWSKCYKISERMVISNYCLVMLMFFYLQNLEVPMLDTIKNNQEANSPIIIDQKYQWNVFFNDRLNLSKQNSLSTCKLLAGFFEFYHKLNFSKYILSLYNGELILRENFLTHPDFERYRKLVKESEFPPIKFDNPQTFIVQDGFELNLNVGIKSKKHVTEFFDWIKVSHEKCLELKGKPFSSLLIELFQLKLPENSAENQNRSKAKKKFQMTIYSIAGDLKLCQDILSARDKVKVFNVEDQQRFFYHHVYESSVKFLQEIYLCTIVPEQVDETPEAMVKQFKIILHVDTINGRKKINFKDDASLSNEINLSRKMNEKKIRFELDISMKISSKDKGKSINIEMVDNDAQKKTALSNFGNFFAVNIPQALKFYLKKKLEEATK